MLSMFGLPDKRSSTVAPYRISPAFLQYVISYSYQRNVICHVILHKNYLNRSYIFFKDQILLTELAMPPLQKFIMVGNEPLSYRNRRCKHPYYETASQTPGFNDLAVCYCNTWPAGQWVSHDVWLIKVKVNALEMISNDRMLLRVS
jgi:hypothetical protein